MELDHSKEENSKLVNDMNFLNFIFNFLLIIINYYYYYFFIILLF